MTFTKDSAIVKLWIGLIQRGRYTEKQVPKLYNLREVVSEVLSESTEAA